jgi:hypothetical protein
MTRVDYDALLLGAVRNSLPDEWRQVAKEGETG